MKRALVVLSILSLALLTACANLVIVFSIGTTVGAVSLPLGSDVVITVEVDRSGGFAQPVVVTVTGLPNGVSAANLTIDAADASGDLTLSATAGAQTGPATLTIVGTAGAEEATAELDLTVTAPGQLNVTVAATGLTIPWDIAFAPDGSLLITERGGTFKRLLETVLSDIAFNPVPPFATGGEPGLLGMALDPAFAVNGYLYLCYSYTDNGPLNRISRFTLQGNELIGELQLLNAIPGSSVHNGCRMAIGPDQMLYATMGDANDSNAAQDQNSLSGKIFRLELNGAIPADNPFPGSPVWTLGHRNPQGLAFHPDNGRLYSTEHGPASDDEINLIEEGNNYGWPTVMGTAIQAPFTPALLAYTPTLAVAGMAFYQGTLFPWENDILFVSLKAGQLRRLELAPDGTIAADHVVVDNDYGRLRAVAVAPDGRIFLATSNQDGRANAPFPHADDDRILVLEPGP